MNNVNTIYFIVNAFSAYTVSVFMNVFFNKRHVNKKNEVFLYFLYFLGLCGLFLFMENVIITILFNIIFIFILTFNYKSRFKDKIIATTWIYMILILVEVVSYLIVNLIKISYETIIDEMSLPLVFSRILAFIIVRLMANYKNVKNSVNLSLINWVSVVFIPLGSIFTLIILFYSVEQTNTIYIFLGVITVFIMNVLVFNLYDSLIDLYKDKNKKEILEFQNKAYTKQFNSVFQSQKNLRLIKHDIKNHINVLKYHITENTSSAISYADNIIESMDTAYEYAKSGNFAVDSILNYKIYQAMSEKIEVELHLSVPSTMEISSFDMTVIIGNLMDNAIEATKKLGEGKTISVNMKWEKNLIYLTVINPYSNTINIKDNKFTTSKQDNKNEHGIGLESVKKSIEKYDGIMEIDYQNGMFIVKTLLYDRDK